jgi:hypothetical protein
MKNFNEIHKDYKYDFDSLYENKKTKKYVIKFMEKSFISENHYFLESVHNFKNQKNLNLKKELVKNIIEKYIEDDSLYEINLPSRIKNNILNKKNEILKGEFNNEIFDECYNNISQDISTETLQKLIKDTEFTNKLEKIYKKIGSEKYEKEFLLKNEKEILKNHEENTKKHLGIKFNSFFSSKINIDISDIKL